MPDSCVLATRLPGEVTCAPILGGFSFVFHRIRHHLPSSTDLWRRKCGRTWKRRPCILLPVRICASVANARQPAGPRASRITQASKGALSRWKQRGEAEPRGAIDLYHLHCYERPQVGDLWWNSWTVRVGKMSTSWLKTWWNCSGTSLPFRLPNADW